MPAFAATKGEVLTTYSDIAFAGYEDSLTTAQALNDAVEALIAVPSDDTLAAGRRSDRLHRERRGGRIHRFTPDGGFVGVFKRADVCGLAALAEGYLATDGLGGVIAITPDGTAKALNRATSAWDNHLIAF